MRVVTIVGARPQFVKLAPVSQALRPGHEEFVVHTGQHYDDRMSRAIFEDLGIREPDLNLGIGSASHGAQTAAALTGVEKVVLERRPDLVLVYGDTNATLAGALVAAKCQVPLAHVEAGLRSFRRSMPEEVNRVVADHCSDLLLAPTPLAVVNLRREGIVEGVHWTGDVMFDVALANRERARQRFAALAAEHGLEAKRFLLATVHRAENTDRPETLAAILDGLGACGEPVLLPLHPRTRKMLDEFGLGGRVPAAVRLTEPAGYLDMLALEANARVILTDSGGVQKEGYFAGTPVVTLREETEWEETVTAGWNQVVGTDPARVAEAVAAARPGLPIAAYGEGDAARRIVQVLTDWAEARGLRGSPAGTGVDA